MIRLPLTETISNDVQVLFSIPKQRKELRRRFVTEGAPEGLRPKKILLGLILSLVLTASGWAKKNQISGLSLLEWTDARAAALAEAGATLDGDLSGTYHNPAAAAWIGPGQFTTQVQVGVEDVKTGILSYGRSGTQVGWAMSVLYFDAGSIDLSLPSGDSKRRAQQDLGLSLTGAWKMWDSVSLGATVKGFQSRLVEEYSAQTVATDAGLRWALPFAGFSVGASAQNMGGKLKYRREKEDIPTLYRFGLGYASPDRQDVQSDLNENWWMSEAMGRSFFTVALDGILDAEGDAAGLAGFEWDYAHRAILRAGYRASSDDSGVTLGVGFRLKKYQLDYAVQMIDTLNDRHRLAFSFFF